MPHILYYKILYDQIKYVTKHKNKELALKDIVITLSEKDLKRILEDL